REALSALGVFLDRAVRAGHSEIRVVHGIGTGALRKAVQEFLATSPYCVKYREAAPQAGGSGVTIAGLGERAKTGSWLGSGGESGTPVTRTTGMSRPAKPARQSQYAWHILAASSVPCLPRQLRWPRHGGRRYHHTIHARCSSPTQDAVLGRH